MNGNSVGGKNTKKNKKQGSIQKEYLMLRVKESR